MKLYRLLLLLYPRDFRLRFGPEMMDAFECLLGRVREERGTPGVAVFWVRAVGDAVVSGLGERLSRRTRVNKGNEAIMMRTWFHIVHAFRSLRRAPGYAAAFVVTLGLAIGVNSAVFSMVNGVLLRPLPFSDAERILFLKQPVANQGSENALFSFMEIDDYRESATTIDEFVEFGDWSFTVLGEGEAHRAVGGLVTSNYFSVLGMRPALGRLLNEEDDVRGAEPVLLLTDAYWERVFGRDPAVIGRTLDLEDIVGLGGLAFKPARVVGVLEPGLHYTGSRRPDFYVNYAVNSHYQDAAMRDSRGHRMTDVFARMAPGVSIEAARAELGSIAARLHDRYPEAYDPDLGFGFEAVPWQEELTRSGRSTFLILMGTVAMILLLAAANVTNLTLTRLIRKEVELSTRAALGASRRDLRLHLTAENAILGLLGGVLGILLAYASRGSLVAYASRFTVRAQEVGIDWTVLGATLGGGVLVAASLAWMPWLPIGAGTAGVASTRTRATGSRIRKQVQRGLVVSQLALSFTLLVGAGLLVRSLIELRSVDPGFGTEQILTIESPTGPAGVALPGQRDPGWDQALDEIRGYPGVRAAAVASWTPLSDHAPAAITIQLEGEERIPGEPTQLSAGNNVSPDFFGILDIPLISGRFFEETDRGDSPDVIILNESMARAYFGDADPIGRRLSIVPDFQHVFQFRTYEVVGVVADTREYGMDTEGVHTFYLPAAKTSHGPAILVSHQGDAGPLAAHVRDVIQRMDPERAIENVRTMASLVEQDVAPSRLNAMLFGSFSILALLIAAVGVFSTLAFSVNQRVREFGIRMALGADRESVLRNVLSEGAVVAVLALALGALGVVALARFLGGLLFGVAPLDAMTLALAAVTLAAVALTASLLPALKATRIQPSQALRSE